MTEILIIKGLAIGISSAIAHTKRFEAAMISLTKNGLKTEQALDNLSNLFKSICSEPLAMPFLSSSDPLWTPWAPLHGIQAKFFRFNPRKWHTILARIAPVISHHLNLFHRRCWMQLKTYVNFRFLRPA